MGDSPDSKLVATRALIATYVRGATALLAAEHPEWGPAITAAGGALGSVLGDYAGQMMRAGEEMSRARLMTGMTLLVLARPWTPASGPPPIEPAAVEDEAREITRRFTDPFLHANARVITRAFLEALEDEALVPLAALARMYLLERRRVDHFYRSTAAFLVEADVALLRGATALVRGTLQFIGENANTVELVTMNGDLSLSLSERGNRVSVRAVQPGSNGKQVVLGELADDGHTELMRALERARLGRLRPGAFGSRHLYFTRSMMVRLAIVFGIDDHPI